MYHLHNHSHYSVLDGLTKIDQMIERCREIGADAVAINDHASIAALPEFYKKCKAAGIKPIIGCEFYVVDDVEGKKGERRLHLNVMAKNWDGVKSIMRQLTLANKQFFYRPRLTFEQIYDFKDCIVTTACCGGVLDHPEWERIADDLNNTYGEDLYLEIMPFEIFFKEDGLDHQRIVNQRCEKLIKIYGTKVIATNDAHFARKEDIETHDILLCIQTGRKITDPDRWRFDPNSYMKSVDEMREGFDKLGYLGVEVIEEALKNTVEVVAKCNVEMPEFPIELPTPHPSVADGTKFAELIQKGWEKKIKPFVDSSNFNAYKERLLYEIGIIRDKNFERYFLVVEDLIRWARSQGIMIGPGRGSAAGSLICYLLDITQLDPIKHDLIFERFLNPSRPDWPDVDIDVQDDRREEVIQYLRGKYGEDNTAMISTYGYLGPKSAFRDVCRTFNIDMPTINKLSKLVEEGQIKDATGKVIGTHSAAESFDHVPELIEFRDEHPEIIKQTLELDGTIRQTGLHAAGFIVSSKPLEEVTSVSHQRGKDAICWDKKSAETFGLIKLDLLGLSTLTVLQEAARLIKENHGHEIDFTRIPMDDMETGEQFRRGNTVGIFQFENDGTRALLRAIRAKTFPQVQHVTALYRPGSLESGETRRYTNIAQGNEYEQYTCPELEKILKPTLGVLVYQEQMMRIFTDMGGFTLVEAEGMRKIVGKKLGKEAFEEHRKHFVDGCMVNGIDSGVATEIFDKMVSFANYSFNASHAASYAHISWWSMYLKTHYPTEYMCSLLSNTTKDDKVPAYIEECEALGIRVRMPDINCSEATKYKIDEGEIIAPLTVIKGVGPKVVERIVEERQNNGIFASRRNLEDRIDKRLCNKRVRDCLFRADAFASVGDVEPDPEKRVKNLKTLLGIFQTLPRYTLGHRAPIDAKELINCLTAVKSCGADNEFMKPVFKGVTPSIMIVNNATPYEKGHLRGKGTKYLLAVFDEMGITERDFYYTSPIKCKVGNLDNTPEECMAHCLKHLREEIKVVKPQLIICCTTQFLTFFGAPSLKMGEAAGSLIFNEDLDSYVLFSYSPQYANFNTEIDEKFRITLGTVAKIFDVAPPK